MAAHGFVSNPSLLLYEHKQQLFIHLISPSTLSANKHKQMLNNAWAFYFCHPPRQNHGLKKQEQYKTQTSHRPTGKNKYLIQSVVLEQWVLKTYIFLKRMKNLPKGCDDDILCNNDLYRICFQF